MVLGDAPANGNDGSCIAYATGTRFETADWALVAWLRVARLEPIDVSAQWSDNRRQVIWAFQRNLELEDLVLRFSGGMVTVNLRAYTRAYAAVRRDVREHLSGDHEAAS